MGLSVASRIPFHDLCNLCEKLSLASREKRLTMFSKYVAFFRDFGDKLKEEVPEVVSQPLYFSFMLLVLFHLDAAFRCMLALQLLCVTSYSI